MTRVRDAASGLILAAGAGVYAVVEGVVDVKFVVTPLFLGLVAVAAGALGTRHRVVGTGLVLAGWGAAVVLVDHHVVPVERTTPAYMLGLAVGLICAGVLAGRPRRAEWLASGAVAAFLGPLGLYLSYDIGALGRWPVWALTMVVWAGWELFWGLRRRPAFGLAEPVGGHRQG